MNKVVDMVQMVGWPKDVSLDVDLDVEKIKSALIFFFWHNPGQHPTFWMLEPNGWMEHPNIQPHAMACFWEASGKKLGDQRGRWILENNCSKTIV